MSGSSAKIRAQHQSALNSASSAVDRWQCPGLRDSPCRLRRASSLHSSGLDNSLPLEVALVVRRSSCHTHFLGNGADQIGALGRRQRFLLGRGARLVLAAAVCQSVLRENTFTV